MKQFARRWLKTISIWSVICLVALDSALACRWRAARRGHGRCAASPEWSECCDFSAEPPREVTRGEEGVPPPTRSPSDQTAPPELEPAPAADAVPQANETRPPPSAAPATPSSSAPAPPAEEEDPFASLSWNTSAAPPAPTAAAAGSVDDDPFASLQAKPAMPSEIAATPAADPDADPFEISSSERQEVRQWVDDTGYFRVRGRLVAVLDGKIRILKETGRTTTVSMSRLSPADREFVAGQ